MTLVFDAEVLLARYFQEPGAARILPLLDRVAEGRERGVVSRVNLAEVLYKLERRSPGQARGALAHLALDGVEAFPCEPVWEGAGLLKARRPELSLGDAFAMVTAQILRAELVLRGDKDLERACRAERVRVRRV